MYVRAVQRSAWSGLVEQPDDDTFTKAIHDLVRTGRIVSVFECESDADLELIAVAISAKRLRQDFHFIRIESSDLEAAAISTAASEGGTPLPAANRLHRDVDLSGDGAERLVRRLHERGLEIRTLRERQLRAAARKLSASGHSIPEGSWLLR